MAIPQLGPAPDSLNEALTRNDMVDLTLPTGWLRANCRRQEAGQSNIAALSSGRMGLYTLTLYAGDVITKLGFVSGTTGAASPTNQWFALYDLSRSLLRQTTNDTNTAWAASTLKSLNLSSSYTVTATGLYYVGICVTASTVPNLNGITGVAAILGLSPVLAGTSNTGLTTTAPSTANAPTSVGNTPYVLAG